MRIGREALELQGVDFDARNELTDEAIATIRAIIEPAEREV